MKIAIAAATVYVVVGFLTFGLIFNEHSCGDIADSKSCRGSVWGLIWPIYWLGKLALEVTK